MGLRDMYSAGDIIEYEGGGRDYLVAIEGEEGLWVNACNPSWVERGLRGFCDGTGYEPRGRVQAEVPSGEGLLP